MKDLNDVRNIFKKDRFTSMVGITIEEVGEGYARCILPLEEKHQNALGIPMGGAIFTLADVAFGANVATEGRVAVTLHADISYLRASKGNTLVAESRLIKYGKTVSLYRVDITDDMGVLIATAMITGFILE